MPSPSTTHPWPQFVKFCIVGVLNTGVDFSVYFILTRSVWEFSDLITIPKAISYLVATMCSFTVNRYWTFGKTGAVEVGEVARFYGTVGLGIFINVGVQYAAVVGLEVFDLYGVIIAAAATAVWGFLFSKFYVFSK